MPSLIPALLFYFLAPLSAGPGCDSLILRACAPVPFQQWSVNATAVYTFAPPHAMCMNIASFFNSTAPFATVATWPCSGLPNQQFNVSANAIASLQTPPTCLAVDGGPPYYVGSAVTNNMCNATDPLQEFVWKGMGGGAGAILHPPSGLCIDCGSSPPPPKLHFCEILDHASWTICNSLAPLGARAADIVGRLSVEDKILATSTAMPGLWSVAMPAYEWWAEATHGVGGPGVQYNSMLPGAVNTALPITTSCAFNRTLWLETGNMIGREARAFYNANQSGSSFWAPVVNLARDPRWGRILECPGEDPLTTSEYAVHFVKGFQTAKESPFSVLQASACCKHFLCNSLESWNGTDRFHADVFVPQQDLADSYLVPFQGCVEEGKASGIMCSVRARHRRPPPPSPPHCFFIFALVDPSHTRAPHSPHPPPPIFCSTMQ